MPEWKEEAALVGPMHAQQRPRPEVLLTMLHEAEHVLPSLLQRMERISLPVLRFDGNGLRVALQQIASEPAFYFNDQQAQSRTDQNKIGASPIDLRFVVDDAVIRQCAEQLEYPFFPG